MEISVHKTTIHEISRRLPSGGEGWSEEKAFIKSLWEYTSVPETFCLFTLEIISYTLGWDSWCLHSSPPPHDKLYIYIYISLFKAKLLLMTHGRLTALVIELIYFSLARDSDSPRFPLVPWALTWRNGLRWGTLPLHRGSQMKGTR